MPEAIKEVAPEKTPEKIAAKEIKPAEASSGTLPADEQPLKDGEEGAVAPEVAAVETPEEGKSIPEPSAQQGASASDGNGVTDPPKEEVGSKSGDEPEKASNGSCSDVVQPSADHETSKKSDSVKNEEPEKGSSVTVMESNSEVMKDGSNTEDKKDEGKPVESSIKGEENTKDDLHKSSENKVEEKNVNSSNVSKNSQDSCMNGDKSEKLENETLEIVKETSTEVKDNTMDTKVDETSKEPKIEDISGETKVEESAVEPKKDNDTAVESKETVNESKIEEMAVESKGDETAQSKSEESTESKSPAPSNDTLAQPTPDIKADSESKKEPESQNNEVDAKMEIDTEGSEKQSGNSDSKIPVSESSSVENGKSEAGRSVDVDPVQVEEIKKLISDAKVHMVGGEHFNAADLLGKACEIAGKLYGDLASENGELYYLYGCSMLECAKNENTVLGEAVKEEEEEVSEDNMDDKEDDSSEQKEDEEVEKQNGDEPAVNGDEAMEVVEEEAEASIKENGVDSEATAADGEKENEEDDSSLKTAWEMFELAKVIFGKTENSSRLADTYIKLGEVGMESGHGDSIDDMKKALELRLGFASENHRLLAETHFNIGLAYATFQNFDSAIESFQQSKSLLEAKINKLKNSDKTKDSEDEIKELSGLLPDLDEKIQDMKDSKAAKIKGEEDSKQGGASSSETSSKPVSNISHLVKRKRKLEDVTSELLPNTKQPCTDEDKPESAKSCEDKPEPVKSGEDKPETVKSCEDKPETVKSCEDKPETVKSCEEKSVIASNEDKLIDDSAKNAEEKETPKTVDSAKEECAPKEEKADEKSSLEPSIPMEETPSEGKSTTPTQKEEAASV